MAYRTGSTGCRSFCVRTGRVINGRFMAKRIDKRYLRNAAFSYLQRYASSTENLRRVLRRKVHRRSAEIGQDPSEFESDIEAVLVWCSDNLLLDDKRYAELRLNSLRQKGSSVRKIRADLVGKGLPQEIIEDLIESTGHSEVDAARRYIERRRLGKYRKTGVDNAQEKDLASLARAGFSYSVAQQALRYEESD